MRRTLAALALAAASCSSIAPETAQAQAGPSIEACLAASPARDAMQQCKRIVYSACIREPEYAQSTYGMVMCNEREGEAWSALLNAHVTRAAISRPDRAELLAAANAAWTEWIEAECNYHRSESGGG